jgi:peptidoglycan hydrolase-like protein with peptidoglycan-binding domain
MTPRISLIVAVVAAALVSVPAAFGDNWGADRQSQTIVGSPDAVDRALAAEQQRLETMLDARERAYGTKREVQLGTGPYPDVTQRAVAAYERMHGFRGDDRFTIDPSSQPGPVSVTGDGRDIQWPQVGIGFGIALALLMGLLLALRGRRHPLAH